MIDTVLVILSVIGFAAMVISAYVFTAAARHYVSEDSFSQGPTGSPPFQRVMDNRRRLDRRRGGSVTFPLEIDGKVIERDRRVNSDRRVDLL